MMKKNKHVVALLLALVLAGHMITGCADADNKNQQPKTKDQKPISPNHSKTSKTVKEKVNQINQQRFKYKRNKKKKKERTFW